MAIPLRDAITGFGEENSRTFEEFCKTSQGRALVPVDEWTSSESRNSSSNGTRGLVTTVVPSVAAAAGHIPAAATATTTATTTTTTTTTTSSNNNIFAITILEPYTEALKGAGNNSGSSGYSVSTAGTSPTSSIASSGTNTPSSTTSDDATACGGSSSSSSSIVITGASMPCTIKPVEGAYTAYWSQQHQQQ